MSVATLMNEITYLDCDPGVFKVYVMSTDHSTGFTAWVDFRSPKFSPKSISSISAYGETPEEALEILLNTLKEKYTRCDKCGQYKHG